MKFLLLLALVALAVQLSFADLVKDVRFNLYTRQNRGTPRPIRVGNLNGAPLNRSKPTKLIIHGYISAANGWVLAMKNKFLAKQDCNVITVDWSRLSYGTYGKVRKSVPSVGKYVGQMYKYLTTLGLKGGNIHCVGHSLGAHVCGLSGKASKGLGRITGLDPAQPLFSIKDPSGRLARSDAAFVDVIHTSGLAFAQAIGHADFYPNAGRKNQPGCSNVGCNHGRAIDYFLESIDSNGFVGRLCVSPGAFNAGKCKNTRPALMGNPCKTNTRGNFYLGTNSKPPYARKRIISEIETDDGEINLELEEGSTSFNNTSA